MEDYFGRTLEKGDTILWMASDSKEFSQAKVIGFGKQFGKPYAETDHSYRARVQKGFIIIKKENGHKLQWMESTWICGDEDDINSRCTEQCVFCKVAY